MLATVLFVQGAGDMHHPEGSIHIARWLERELSDDLRVLAPEMPDAENPGYERDVALTATTLPGLSRLTLRRAR